MVCSRFSLGLIFQVRKGTLLKESNTVVFLIAENAGFAWTNYCGEHTGSKNSLLFGRCLVSRGNPVECSAAAVHSAGPIVGMCTKMCGLARSETCGQR